MEEMELLNRGGNHYLSNLSIDIVITAYKDNKLKLLLLQIGDKWLLPGGYIEKKESVETAANRILKERTGLDDAHLKFLSVFGHHNRHFGEEIKAFFESRNYPWDDDYWINSRFVTLGYYSFVDINHASFEIGGYDENIAWFDFNDLPEMWMDHNSIAMTARNQLKEDIKNEVTTYNLLSDHFTMPELHRLHEVILEEKIDRSRFQKKMLASGIFERLPKLETKTPGRNPYLYKLKID